MYCFWFALLVKITYFLKKGFEGAPSLFLFLSIYLQYLNISEWNCSRFLSLAVCLVAGIKKNGNMFQVLLSSGERSALLAAGLSACPRPPPAPQVTLAPTYPPPPAAEVTRQPPPPLLCCGHEAATPAPSCWGHEAAAPRRPASCSGHRAAVPAQPAAQLAV